MPLLKTTTALAALAAAASSSASVDTSPKPGGVYRLKPGVYVEKGIACESATKARMRLYNGRGLDDAKSHACRARVLSRIGDRYDVVQSCADVRTGTKPRVQQRQTVSVADALEFTTGPRGAGTTYRYCPAYMLPAGPRKLAK